MSDFKEKCGDVLTGGATGAAAGGSIGAAIGALGGPVTSALGAKVGGAIGSLAGLFSDQLEKNEVKKMTRCCRDCSMKLICWITGGNNCKQKMNQEVP